MSEMEEDYDPNGDTRKRRLKSGEDQSLLTGKIWEFKKLWI